MSEHETPQPGKLALGEVVRESAAALRENFPLLFVAALIVFVPIGLLEAATYSLEDIDIEDGVARFAVIGAALTITATATIGDVFYTGVVAAAVGGRRSGIRRGLAEIAPRIPYLRLAAVDVLFAAVVAVGLVLLIAPGVVAFSWFVLAAPVVEIEGRGVRAAFRRSRELVRGNFWRVLLLLAPVLIIGDQLANLLYAGGPSILGDGFFGDWLGAVLAEGLTAPLFALAAVVATHHLISGRPAA
ncbi:MAG: hypothetical protein ABI726_03595 [bacterium]